MTLSEIFQQVIFTYETYQLKVGNVLGALLILVLAYECYRLINKRLLPRYFNKEQTSPELVKRITTNVRWIFLFIALIGIIWALNLNAVFYSNETISISIITILQAGLILQLARFIDWIIGKAITYKYRNRAEDSSLAKATQYKSKDIEGGATRTAQYLVYIFAAILILQNFNLDYTLLTFDQYAFKISNIFIAIFILLMAQLIAWILTQLILDNYYRKNEVNEGSQYAINQLLKYVIFIIAAFMALESLGIKMTVIWGGAAALLVGIGLGLQQTFNDLISGIILLFERTVEVGDMVEANNDLVGRVKKIGIRTSIIETRDNITVVVPNSKLVNDNVVNWTHYDDRVRFKINVGVAYGSKTELVKQLLLGVAKDNVYVLEHPSPMVRFISFGDSSLDFELIFWSRNVIVIEDVKSDMRFEIDRLFRENEIEIPFPQRDVWMKK